MKLTKRIFILMVIVFVSATIINAMRFHYGLSDALLRTIFFVFEDTRWAKDYTEDGFDRLAVGMSTEEVLKILGEPLRKSCFSVCEWVYTWQQDSWLDFDRRAVIFDENMRLIAKRRAYFVD